MMGESQSGLWAAKFKLTHYLTVATVAFVYFLVLLLKFDSVRDRNIKRTIQEGGINQSITKTGSVIAGLMLTCLYLLIHFNRDPLDFRINIFNKIYEDFVCQVLFITQLGGIIYVTFLRSAYCKQKDKFK